MEGVSVGEPLTPDEEQLMWHLAAGEEVGEIAARLSYEVTTVHHKLKAIQTKLGARTRISMMHTWSMLQPRHLVIRRRRRGMNVPVYGPDKTKCE